MEGFAREGEVGFAQCLVLGRVGVQQLGHILRVGFPVHDQLRFADLLAHAGADHVDAHHGAVLLADKLDDAAGAEDGALAVTGKVVFLGLDLVVAKLLLGGLFRVAHSRDFGIAVSDLGDVDVLDDHRLQPGDFLGHENALLVAAVRQLDARDDVAHGVDVADAGVQALVGDDEAAVDGDAGVFVTEVGRDGAAANSYQEEFGVDVTIVEGLPSLVPNEDAAIVKNFERAFKKRGIKFSTGVFFQGVEQNGDGVKVTLVDGKTFEADLLLVAVGRGPVTANLGYEEAGITIDRGFVITNERLHTGVGNIYAVGDIVPGVQLAHRGYQQGIFVAEEIAGLKPVIVEDVNIPKVTYCEPEIATVGYTEKGAKAKFGDDQVEIQEYNLAGNGKSSILGTGGLVKLVRQKDGPVVGVHMIGARMGEQVGEAQLIVNWEAYPEDVAQLLHAHPTQNEALGEAHLALAGKALHG